MTEVHVHRCRKCLGLFFWPHEEEFLRDLCQSYNRVLNLKQLTKYNDSRYSRLNPSHVVESTASPSVTENSQPKTSIKTLQKPKHCRVLLITTPNDSVSYHWLLLKILDQSKTFQRTPF